MDTYVEEIRKLENKFVGLEIHHVDRDNNVGADVLSKLGSTRAAIPPGVFVHELHHPSVKVPSQQVADMGAPATVREILMKKIGAPSLSISSKISSFLRMLILKVLKLPVSSGVARVSSSSVTTYTSALLPASS